MLGGMSEPILAHRWHGSDGGLPLVLLHAFPLDRRMWDDLIDELSDLRILTLDAPGFGSSPAYSVVADRLGRSGEPSLETYADAVAATLRASGIDRAVVAGLSMGGYALLALAERHRSLLAGVALLDTKAEADGEEARAGRLAMAEAAERAEVSGDGAAEVVAPMAQAVLGGTTLAERPDVVSRVREWLAQAPAAGIAWAQRAMAARPTRLTAVEDLEVPGLVLRGAEDELSTQSSAEAMAERLRRQSTLKVVPRAGHLSAVESPAVVAGALRALHASATAHESGAPRN